MIETVPKNWQRWSEKERFGVNRGFQLAFLNTNRADHTIRISYQNSRYQDESEVIVSPESGGNWKSPSNEETKRFTGDEEDEEDLLEQGCEYAREWMENHPCQRGETRDDIELLTDIFEAVHQEGLEIQHDKDVRGVVRSGVSDQTSHNIRMFEIVGEDETVGVHSLEDADALLFHIGIDGYQSPLRYRKSKESRGDDTITVHDPVNQSKLHPYFMRAFESIGFSEVQVANGGHQRHWDHSISYGIQTEVPDDMALDFPETEPRQK